MINISENVRDVWKYLEASTTTISVTTKTLRIYILCGKNYVDSKSYTIL